MVAYGKAPVGHNPINLDDVVARTVGLPGGGAHGLLQMGLMGTVAADAAGGADKLRRLYCRFGGMVQPGDTVTFTAEPGSPGTLALGAVNQRGEPVLTKAVAEIVS